MPTFCRHNRFIERCPICSRTLPGQETSQRARSPRSGARTERAPRGARAGARASAREEGLRVRREGRAGDDGYRSALAPGLRASADAERLAEEIAFSSGRLLVLGAAPPGLYGEARELAARDLERATWTVFLIAYLSPLEDSEDPFAGVRAVLDAAPAPAAVELAGAPLGPRSSHDPARGASTLEAYRQWVERAAGAARVAGGAHGGAQQLALRGDAAWSPSRRFARQFERLSLPGLGRTGRYELLLLLGRLGLYELRADSLQLAGFAQDATTLAAKRVFGIGQELLLERRAAALAEAAGVPIEALDLALSNWAAPRRATLGFPAESSDPQARRRAGAALGV
jgi:hypothetical protein